MHLVSGNNENSEKSQEPLGLEGTSGDYPVQVSCQELNHLEIQEHVQVGLEFYREEMHNLPGQPVPVLHHPQCKEIILNVEVEILVFNYNSQTVNLTVGANS